MKTEIQIFTSEVFGEIRTCQVNNQIMFVGSDVAKALGYAKPQNALATHVDSEDKTTAPIQGTGSNYKTKVVIINESGLYALILSSKLPQAKAFKHWVTAEVLPQIRKTGGYIPTHAADGSDLSAEEILNRADIIVGRTLRILNEEAEDTLTATQVAKTFNMTTLDFNAILRDMGIQHHRGYGYRPSDSREWVERIRLETMKNDDRTRARQRFRVCVTAQRMVCCLMLCKVCETLIQKHGLTGAEAKLKQQPGLCKELLLKAQTPTMLEAYDVIADQLLENALYFFRDRIENAFQSRDYASGQYGERQKRGKNDSIFERLDNELQIERSARGNFWLHFAVRPSGNRRKVRLIQT